MISGLIPRRYAKALFKFAAETGKTEVVYGQMKAVIDAFRANASLCKTLSNPFVKDSDKRTLLLTSANAAEDSAYGRFVTLVLDHRREEFFELMALAYRDIYREENKISQVRITTAAPLPDAEMERFHKVVENAFKDRKFEYYHSVNPELIGGFIIDVDSTRMDASISGELEQLRQNLITGN